MRKKLPTTRDSRLVVRVRALEKKAIERAAHKSGHKLSNYLRSCALGKTLYYRLTEDELRLYKLLVEYRRNFTRVSNLIKEGKDFRPELEGVIDDINQQLQKFNS